VSDSVGAWPKAPDAGSVPARHRLHPCCFPSDPCLECHAARRSTSLWSPDTFLPRANECWRWLKRSCWQWRLNRRLTPSSRRCNLGERPSRHSSVFCSPCPQWQLVFLPAVCVVHTRMAGFLCTTAHAIDPGRALSIGARVLLAVIGVPLCAPERNSFRTVVGSFFVVVSVGVDSCGVLTYGSGCAELKISGRVTNCSHMHTTPIRCAMSRRSETRNWVRAFPASLCTILLCLCGCRISLQESRVFPECVPHIVSCFCASRAAPLATLQFGMPSIP
jgi:hypothetical protein